MHYMSPPDAAPETIQAAKDAMKITFFHGGSMPGQSTLSLA
ncbi:hypothetical protein KT99_05662 [Shewanella benthica KT99]|uniref:Uncharacterized protein n=1 Tax=Shewanella benthica KT99 TaxID=314608 RepID=A9DFM8_9GAMM|nr:hypothetical protein KT99_05662 [Shewanella benthica KT99]